MKKLRFLLCVGTLMAAVGIIAPAAMAEATRTWVSGVGDDANPCSRTAPCKTFAGAISKTAAKGEINVIDSGGFGAVTITKAITISGQPFEGGVLTNAANAINVNAGAADKVVLRGLDIEGLGAANVGIRFASGKSLIVDDVVIHDFLGNGIGVPWTSSVTPAIGRLYIRHSQIDSNGAAGLAVAPGTASTAMRISITDANFDDNSNGIQSVGAAGAARISASNCEVSGNTNAGFFAAAGTMNVTDCLIEGNTTGLLGAAGGSMHVASSTITENDTGVNPNGGSILSRGDNTLEDNVSNGAFSGPYSPH